MEHISSEALRRGFPEPEKPVEQMTDGELREFRSLPVADYMGFDGPEGIDGKGDEDGDIKG